jgi:nucleoside-diphosphate-sugar epimerase
MRVFITGGTGFVGSAVIQELIKAGHEVHALTRNEASDQSLAAAGAKPHRGHLEDLDSLRRGAAASDAVIHCAFIHDFTKFAANCEIDRRAIETLGDALAGSSRRLIITSGTGIAAGNGLATEDSAPTSVFPRVASEQAANALASRGVQVSTVRLPQVHGVGDHAFVPMLINLAREKGVSAYIGDGSNVWPAVHRLDAATLYRLALETSTPAPIYHANAEEGIPVREIATVIGRRLNIPVVSKSPGEEAAEHFGWFAHFAGMNNPTSSQKTRQLLNWNPTHPNLIPDLDQPTYFKS